MIELSAQTSAAPQRAVLYLRQSIFREESISLELQETAAREYSARMGYQVIAVEADPGISGRTWKRPAVQRVMAMIERREADVVVLWKWSRFSRDDYDWAVARKIARTAGGRIESATEPNNVETPEGRLMLNQMIAFAVYESDRIGSVWKETHARRRRLGLPHSGVDRFGYRRTEEGTYEIDPETGPALREAYERYLRGESFTKICLYLNQNGFTTTKGRPWERVSLTGMLDAGFGAGLLVSGPRSGRRSVSTCTYTPGAHAGVIDEATWEVFRRRRLDTPKPPRVIEPKYMLAGLVYCGDCGAPMHHGATRKAAIYICSRSREKRGTVRGVAIQQNLIEQFVTEWVQQFAQDADALMAAMARATETRTRAINDAAAIERRINRLDQQMAQLTVRHLDGKIPEMAYLATVAQLEAQRSSLASREVSEYRRAAAHEVDVRQVSVTLAEHWDRYSVAAKRAALGELIDRIIVVPAPRRGTGVWRQRISIKTTFE